MEKKLKNESRPSVIHEPFKIIQNHLKKILIYFSFALLVLRSILWYADNQRRNELHKLNTESDILIRQADSLKSLKVLSLSDSITVMDLQRKQRQLLTAALNKQLTARDTLSNHLALLNKLDLTANIFFGLALISLVIVAMKGR